ncbi:MAG: hypothetical protein K6L75_04835 [Cellvibrionaceae bacterium]
MTLHIINSLSDNDIHVERCINCAVNGDVILFLSARNVLTKKPLKTEALDKAALKKIKTYLLTNEETNDILVDPSLKNITFIEYKEFVALSIKHEKSITWF